MFFIFSIVYQWESNKIRCLSHGIVTRTAHETIPRGGRVMVSGGAGRSGYSGV